MNEAIKCQQSGIKCDNTNCDYKIDVNEANNSISDSYMHMFCNE